MLLRPATEADLPAILNLMREVVPPMNAAGNFQWDATYPNRDTFEADIRREQLWVAQLGEAVVGIAALTPDQDPEYIAADWDPTASAIVVHRLAIAPAIRRRGIAQALLAQAELLAAERGYHRVRIDTNVTNEPMQRLLQRLGYRFAGEIGLAFRPGLRFFCYEKVLLGS